ncbi:MAG: threonine synthase [Firmicutes bacterium]|nr:threonine synthase [Bacillota bacterium]
MIYHSTRDHSCRLSGPEAILQGLAPDGGLMIFETLPAFDVKEALKLDPIRLQAALLSAFFPEIPEMEALVSKAYLPKFDTPEITPTVPVGPFTVLELFHGPTYAFKDIALCILPYLMRESLRLTGKDASSRLHILTATSGDTGKAAMAGFANVPGILLTVFYPHGGVAPMQRLQMVTQQGENLSASAIIGDFDDAQSGVKKLFMDQRFGEKLGERGIHLSSANSINIGRLIPQIMYYFKAYQDLLSRGHIHMGDEVNFCVPTGNFGDILAGYLAKLLGLPVGRLLVASNQNNVLTDFFHTGIYDRRRELVKTTSPSMDILISSNLERLLYLLSESCGETAAYMKQLQEEGFYRVSDQLKEKLDESFWSGFTTDEEAASAIGEVYQSHQYLLDPHTAAGWHAAKVYQKEHPEDARPMVVLSTASVFKFPKVVLEAASAKTADPVTASSDPFEQLDQLSAFSSLSVPANLALIRSLPELHPAVIEPSEMKAFVMERS